MSRLVVFLRRMGRQILCGPLNEGRTEMGSFRSVLDHITRLSIGIAAFALVISQAGGEVPAEWQAIAGYVLILCTATNSAVAAIDADEPSK